jgi:glutamate-1-semialdehyde 2,1-aminomutase
MSRNSQALATAKTFFPGGVNSPVRAFAAVGGEPPFIASGKGPTITDVDGKTYLDYVGSWGPLILGHADPDVVQTIARSAEQGTTFGAPTERESELARLVKQAFPSMEKMRLVSSGTEATMSAIRLARGATHRPLIVKFDGCYHGHADSLLVSAGSGVATLGIPGCPGITDGTAAGTLVCPFNDLESVKKVLAAHRRQIAAIILEPVCGNIGVVLPKPGFLQALRDLTTQEGIVLIFDEVMTGFRATFGGVQTLEGVTPDLTCLGKIVGGGLPLAVYGGKADLMKCIAPDGPVYQAGTLSGNPLAVAAGIATLQRLAGDTGLYPALLSRTRQLCDGLAELARRHGIQTQTNVFGSMFTTFFTSTPVTDYATAKTSDTKRFGAWFRAMLEEGVYLAPSQFEAAFVSVTHGQTEIQRTLEAADRALQKVKRGAPA